MVCYPLFRSHIVIFIDGIDFFVVDVYEALCSLSHKFIAGPDGFSPFVFKKLAICFSFPLYILFSEVIHTSKNSIRKSAMVIIVHRKGLKSLFKL